MGAPRPHGEEHDARRDAGLMYRSTLLKGCGRSRRSTAWRGSGCVGCWSWNCPVMRPRRRRRGGGCLSNVCLLLQTASSTSRSNPC